MRNSALRARLQRLQRQRPQPCVSDDDLSHIFWDCQLMRAIAAQRRIDAGHPWNLDLPLTDTQRADPRFARCAALLDETEAFIARWEVERFGASVDDLGLI